MLIPLTILALISWYLDYRVTVKAGFSWFRWVLLGGGLFVFAFFFTIGKVRPALSESWLMPFVLLLFLVYINFLPTFAITDLILYITNLILQAANSSFHFSARLIFYIGAGLTGLVVFPGVIFGYMTPRVRTHRFEIPNLPQSFEHVRILHLSDLHVGITLGKDYVNRMVARLKQEHFDIIAMTGDISDGPASLFLDIVAPLMTMPCKYGSFYVFGNHELFRGTVKGWEEGLASLGVHVLRNSNVLLHAETPSEQLCIAGMNDWEAGRGRFTSEEPGDVEKAVTGVPASTPIVMLTHNPRHGKTAATKNIPLVLTGHTHGGQYIPWGYLFTALGNAFHLSGFLRDGPKTTTFISNGCGHWMPIRLGALSEMTIFELAGSRE